MNPMTTTIINRAGIVALLLATANLMACSDDSRPPAEAPQTSIATTFNVSVSEVPIRYVTSGTVTSDHRVSISSRIFGYIREMNAREGDLVKAGQILVRVDPVDAKQSLIQAKADLADAEADLQRYDELLKDGAVTIQQAARVKLRYKVAKSRVEQARNQLSYAEVRSPVDGVVVEKRLSQGDLAAPGIAILTLEDPASLLVETYVSERYVSRIHTGDHVDIHIAPLKQSSRGIVRQVVQATGPVSHQFLVKIALPAADEVHPGMYAETGFHVGTRQALLIPRAAVLLRSGLHAVYLLNSESIAQYRLLRLGAEQGDYVEVLAGLHAGDVIAWDGNPALKSGMKVQSAGNGQ
ncbi:MAG: efflux RND transporter periplasmic adaptor subunit [Mariprofundaceae bacterium]|nr:efflux RND transporter periplasmic adaptor subunit [Mariprofundaceae bacterium]